MLNSSLTNQIPNAKMSFWSLSPIYCGRRGQDLLLILSALVKNSEQNISHLTVTALLVCYASLE